MVNAKFGKRKIIEANTARRLTLPRVWLSTMGLNVGDTVEVEMMSDGRLVITPSKKEVDSVA